MSAAVQPTESAWRLRLQRFVQDRRFQNTIIALIVVNAVVLGLETSATVMAAMGVFLLRLDAAILAVFVIEIALRLLAWGPLRFFRNPWSVFDFLVVGVALVPASDGLAVLRALRVLRVLRLISAVPQMRRVVVALLSAIPGLLSILALLSLLFYVGAVMATTLFAERFPEWFGSLGASLYTLFQIMTLESWSMGIVRPVMEVYPYAWAFFVPFILVATFTMLNLFIAVVVNAMQSASAPSEEKTAAEFSLAHSEREALRAEIAALREEFARLREALANRR